MIGITKTTEAILMAEGVGLDLIEVSPNSSPPVCKILDHGKWKYEEQKRLSESRKKQKTVEVKEIKIRPNIDNHDLEIKLKAAKKFLENGDKVKITLRFRGREMSYQDFGFKVLEDIRNTLADLAKVEVMPNIEGKQIIMIMAPLTTN